jgi:dTDP-4-amino-4,6-dideoxygalactose transaminase
MEQGLLLPCNHFMSDDDVDFVCSAIAEVVARVA